MKQSPSQANPLLVLLLTMMLLPTACVNRTVETRSLEVKSSAASAGVRRLNINSAAAEQLEALPGIGRVIAERIVEHRAQHGPFRRVEHLMLVRGISERKFLDIEPLITVD